MPNFDDEKPCRYGCVYCFAVNPKFYNDEARPKPMSVADARELVRATLEMSGGNVDFISSACSREVFMDPAEGVAHVKVLAEVGDYKKNVVFPTKTALSQETINELVEIDKRLKENGRRVAMQMSFVSGRERPDLERKTPLVASRIQATLRLKDANIAVGVYIRPILPSVYVATEEILELVDRTSHIAAYTIGAEFAFTDNIASKMRLDLSDPDVQAHTRWNQPLPFAPSSPIWHIFNDPRGERIIADIKSRGKQAFEHAGDTLDFLVSDKS